MRQLYHLSYIYILWYFLCMYEVYFQVDLISYLKLTCVELQIIYKPDLAWKLVYVNVFDFSQQEESTLFPCQPSARPAGSFSSIFTIQHVGQFTLWFIQAVPKFLSRRTTNSSSQGFSEELFRSEELILILLYFVWIYENTCKVFIASYSRSFYIVISSIHYIYNQVRFQSISTFKYIWLEKTSFKRHTNKMLHFYDPLAL